MKASDIPAKTPTPFAAAAGSGFINVIPVSPPVTPGQASFTEGYPPVCFEPIGSGGIPPWGADMNGLGNIITKWLRWSQAAGPFIYDSAFSSAIAGYPKGTLLETAGGGSWWLSLVDDNTTDPETGGANWQLIASDEVVTSSANRVLPVSESSVNYTVTSDSTYSLPQASTVNNGVRYGFGCRSGSATIAPHGTDTINGQGAGVPYVFPVGTSGMVIRDDVSGSWSVFFSTAAVEFPGKIVASAALSVPVGWLGCLGQTVSRTTYAALFAAITAPYATTISITSPAVITWPSAAPANGSVVSFETTGALPTGLSVGTNYYVINSSGTTSNVSATPNGSAINTSGSQSGTQTGRLNPYGCGNGSTTFGIPDLRGRVPAGGDASVGRLTGTTMTPNGNVPGATGGAEQATNSINVTVHTTIDGGQSTGNNSGSLGAATGGANTAPDPHTHDVSGITATGSANGTSDLGLNVQPTLVVSEYVIKT